MFRLPLLLVMVAGLCSGAHCSEPLTYIDLVSRLTDLEALSVLPQAGEKCAQWSSYDRASVYDDRTGKYVRWDANGDGRGIIREEPGGVQVLAEMDGPGCIWRIWSAAPKSGHVRIYLDGATEPAIDMPFEDYFNRTQSPFVYPSLVHVTASGWNSYVPIPYQKSCKITADKDWGNYYHFTYSTFPEGTVVPTFTRNLSGAEKLALAKADYTLGRGLGENPAGIRRWGTGLSRSSRQIEPGTTVNFSECRGAKAITSLKIQVDQADLKRNPHLLREMVLTIRWDDEKEPSVWCPLGDFFGTGPGANEYKSLPLGLTKDGFYSYWYMPFASNAQLSIENQSKETVRLDAEVVYSNLARDICSLGRFHCKWHRDAFLPAEPERKIDWTMLKTEGRGRFCGVVLHVYNPKGGWWGEGDEKFFVDGEKFPSTFGTGSEDYFGYAWGDPTLFQNAYHNQTLNEKKNAGSVSLNRWHIVDNVPFQTSFEGTIEKYFPNDRPTAFAAAAYWYQAAGTNDPYPKVPVGERAGYYQFPVD